MPGSTQGILINLLAIYDATVVPTLPGSDSEGQPVSGRLPSTRLCSSDAATLARQALEVNTVQPTILCEAGGYFTKTLPPAL